MPADPGLLALMRDDLDGTQGLSEKAMFGGICFLRDGNMIGGVSRDHAIFRVGKDQEAAALALPGAEPMTFTGRPMGGFVQLDPDAMGEDETRRALTRMALDHVATLPPK